MVMHTCNLSTLKTETRRLWVPGQPGLHSKVSSQKKERKKQIPHRWSWWFFKTIVQLLLLLVEATGKDQRLIGMGSPEVCMICTVVPCPHPPLLLNFLGSLEPIAKKAPWSLWIISAFVSPILLQPLCKRNTRIICVANSSGLHGRRKPRLPFVR